MKARLLVSLALAFHFLNAHAGQDWLNQMIEGQNKGEMAHKELPKQEAGFFDKHGFILFYGSQCPHCRHFAPTLKAWAERNGAEILPLSFDNQPLPEFPRFLPATTEWVNAAFAGKPINYPALFVVNPKTQALYPVAFGSLTDSELEARMIVLVPKIKAYESSGARFNERRGS